MSIYSANGAVRYAGGRETVDLIVPLVTAQQTLTTHPSTDQFLGNSNQWIWKMDLLGFRQARLTARVTTVSTSANSPRIQLRAHTAFSTTNTDYLILGESSVENSIFTGATLADSGWINILAARRADNMFLALFQIGGDGLASPVVTNIQLHLR